MSPYTDGFFAGRRFAVTEVVTYLTGVASDLESSNPELAALLRGCSDDIERKLV
jgi:hypothetical protein